MAGVVAPQEPLQPDTIPGETQDYIFLAASAASPNNSRMAAAGRQAASVSPAKLLVKNEPNEEKRRLTAPLSPAPAAAVGASSQKVDSATGSAGGLLSAPSRGRKYTVLINSFTQRPNADSFKRKLITQGVPAIISEININNKMWYRVMAGTFEDKSSAEAFAKELKLKNISDNPYVKPIL
jgi:cell division protein FtsN